jgi:hypothetical protein
MEPDNKGGPAFPCHTNTMPGKLANAPQGMALRDYFAGIALGALSAGDIDHEEGWPDYARQAYMAADAMLKQREIAP